MYEYYWHEKIRILSMLVRDSGINILNKLNIWDSEQSSASAFRAQVLAILYTRVK